MICQRQEPALLNRKLTMKERDRSGSALLLVLWAIIVISMAVVGLVTIIQANQDESASLQNAFLARQIATSAVALASHPYVEEHDPIVSGAAELGGHYVVRMESEAARLDINYLLENNADRILVQLFSSWGAEATSVTQLVESLRVWTQPATGIIDSAEMNYYEQRGTGFPPHRPFFSVEEMANVRGMESLAEIKPNWMDYFTVWTGDGVDLNFAGAEVIAAVLGDERIQIDTLLVEREKMRTLPVDGDESREWHSLEEPLNILGVAEDSEAAKFLTVRSSLRRIEATAQVGNRHSLVGAVVQKDTIPSRVLYQYER